jgi:CubicO group peptidase (beta-lactamase class C family)
MSFVARLLPCAIGIVAFTLPMVGESDELEEITHAIDEIRKQYDVSAAAVVIVSGQENLLEHYSGVTDWTSLKPVSRDTYFRLGSITKVFTGLAALRAQQDGLLSLNSRVSEIVPDSAWNNRWSQTHPLRVAHLIEHTAGWFDMSGLEFDNNNSQALSLEEALSLRPESRVMQWPPGWHSEYSNTGPGVAAYVIEQATKQNFDQYVVERVFKPLGMVSASLSQNDEIERTRATGYNLDGRSEIPYWHIVYRASGGLNVRPFEMGRFLQMMLNHGELDGKPIFSRDQIKRLQTPSSSLAAQSGLLYGYGLGVYTSTHNGHLLYGHGGDADGYLAHFKYSRESGKAYLLVINAFNHAPLKDMQKHLDNYLVTGLSKPEFPPAPDLDEALLSCYTGTYRLASVRFPKPGWEKKTMTVRLQDDQLQTSQKTGFWKQLIAVNEKHFRRRNEPVATAAFIPLEDGRMVLQLSNGNYIRDVKVESPASNQH